MTKPSRLVAIDGEPDPDQVVVDMNMLTVGEIETIEELAGMPITYGFEPDKPQGKLMRAVGCVWRRREDPGFTWEQAADLRVYFQAGRPVPPTRGRGSATKSRSQGTSSS